MNRIKQRGGTRLDSTEKQGLPKTTTECIGGESRDIHLSTYFYQAPIMCQALCQVLGMVNQLGSVSSLRDFATSRDDSYDRESKMCLRRI